MHSEVLRQIFRAPIQYHHHVVTISHSTMKPNVQVHQGSRTALMVTADTD